MTPLERTLRLSRFAARVAHARPDVVHDMEQRGAGPFGRQEMRAALEGASAEEIGSRLRRLRERVMFTLAHRDLNGLAPLDEVLDTMTALAQEGMTMIVVTHEIGFAREVADRAVFIDEGVVVEAGPPRQVLSAPQHKRTQAFLSKVL